MKVFVIAKIFVVALFICAAAFGQCFAQERIAEGAYAMDDGNMNVALTLKSAVGGKYSLHAIGADKQGKKCELRGTGEIKNNKINLGGYCSMMMSGSNNRIEIKDTEGCAICEPKAYISGTYEKK